MQMMGLSAPQKRILEAAREVFAEKGYRGGSLNEVAKRSGYTRAGLLHHYPSKEAMLLALLHLRDEQISGYMSETDESLPDFVALLPGLVSRALEDRALVQLAHALTSEASNPSHPAWDWVANRHRALRRRAAAAARRSVERDELRADVDADALAAVVLGAVEGVEAQWLITPEEVDPRRAAAQLASMIGALAPS